MLVWRPWLGLIVLIGLSLAACRSHVGLEPPPQDAVWLPVFDPAALADGRPSEHGELPPLAVRDYGPEGVRDVEPIRVRFNQIVVDPRVAASERGGPQLQLFAFSGPPEARTRVRVPGECRWTAGDTIELVPRQPLARATEFEAVLPAGYRNRDGSTSTGVTWRFETQRPEVTVIGPRDGWALGPAEPVFIRVDPPSNAEELSRHLQVTLGREGGEHKTVALEIRPVAWADLPQWSGYSGSESESGSWFAVGPAGPWPAGARGRLRIEAGLRSHEGPLPLAEDHEVELRTRGRFEVVAVSCPQRQGSSCASGPVVVRTSTAAGRDELEAVRVYPEPDGLAIWEGWSDDEEPTIEVWANFDPETTYTMVLPRRMRDVHGQRLHGKRRVRFEIRDPGVLSEEGGPAALSLSSARGYFARARDARIGILTEHVRSVQIDVSRLDDEQRLAALALDDLADLPWPDGPSTVLQRTLEPTGAHGRNEHVLDLSTLGRAGDALLVQVHADVLTPEADPARAPPAVRGLFQISGLGFVADVSPGRAVGRTTRLLDGEPLAAVHAELHTSEGVRALPPSDAHGLVELPGAAELGTDALVLLRAPTGDDRLAVALDDFDWPPSRGSLRRWYPRWSVRQPPTEPASADPPPGLRPGERALVAVMSGRGVYFPGEIVHLVGWGSIATPYRKIATRRARAGTQVLLELVAADEQTLAQRRVSLDEHGRFWASIPLPEHAPLGVIAARATMLETPAETRFDLADVRVPTFELDASMRTESILHGEDGNLVVRASSLSGQAVAMERVRWRMSCHPRGWHPDTVDHHWVFGMHEWGSAVTSGKTLEVKPPRSLTMPSIPSDALDPERTYACSVSAAAQDATLQEVGADTDFAVHPAAVYLGLERVWTVEVRSRVRIRARAVDLEGRRVAVPGVTMTIERLPEDAEDADDQPKRTDTPEVVATCELDLAAEGEHPGCVVRPRTRGTYRATATATVDGTPIRTQSVFEVQARAKTKTAIEHGPEVTTPIPRRQLAIELPEYDQGPSASGYVRAPAGQPIEVGIVGPWDDGKGWLTIDQTGVREVVPLQLREGRMVVNVTPTPGLGRRLGLTASFARPGGALHPSVSTVSREIEVVEDRSLEVAVSVPEKAQPGDTVPISIAVTDSAGHPVDARVAVWVVDDGIHQLRGRRRFDLTAVFHPGRWDLLQRSNAYDTLLRPFSPFGRGKLVPRVRQAKASVKGALDLDTVRRRFEAVPLFAGDVGTGPDGKARVRLALPDNLTRFRIDAIASAELPESVGLASGPARFGEGQATIAVSAPLMVRAVLPRILRPGDQAEVAAMVTPSSDRSGHVEVELALQDPTDVLEPQGELRHRYRIEDGQPVRASFRVAARGVGEPELRFMAHFVSDDGETVSAGVQRALPVKIERTRIERAAVHGRLDRDEPVAIPVKVPDGVRLDHGGMTLSVRGTMLGDLEDAARYLLDYPYGCVEQTASRLLPLLAASGLTERLVDSKQDLDARVSDHVARLLSMQLSDGRFAYWPDSTRAHPYAGAYVTWMLQLAAQAGHPVPQRAIDKAVDALAEQLRTPLPAARVAREEERARRALTVLVLSGSKRARAETVAAAAADLFEHRHDLPDFARAMLLTAWHRLDPEDERVATLRRQISSSIETVPGAAYPVTRSTDRWRTFFDSPARTHALVLQALLEIDPGDPIVDALARGLARRRTAGRWSTTQENAYALFAMSRYAASREAVAPDHELEIWVGATPPRRLALRGYADNPEPVEVPMRELVAQADAERLTSVVIDRDGAGAAYYRLGMQWTTRADPPPRAQGMTFQRRILDSHEESSTSLRGGRRYALEVQLQTDAPQYFVALEVPLPAGLEAIDTRLGAGGEARDVDGARSPWLSHQELHADRVVLFFDELPPGRHIHTLPVLATTPGRYRLPPARAEAMYAPEIRARTTADVVEVTTSR